MRAESMSSLAGGESGIQWTREGGSSLVSIEQAPIRTNNGSTATPSRAARVILAMAQAPWTGLERLLARGVEGFAATPPVINDAPSLRQIKSTRAGGDKK